MKMKSIMMAVALIATASTIKAQTNSDRISVGVGALYEQGFDMTLSYEHETMRGNISPMVISTGMSASLVATYVLTPFGETIEAMVSVSPISHA